MRLAIVETVNTGLSPDALVLVDISPRWLYGHTLADQPVDPAFGAWVDALTRLTRRLHAVARFFDATQPSFPIVTVEQEHLTWLRAPRQAMTLALAGLYGDQCVMAAAETLARRGHTLVVVRDLCVWENDPPAHYPATVLSAEKAFPGIGAWIAKQDLAPPLHWDGQALYTWK
jgi:hypothetical protein